MIFRPVYDRNALMVLTATATLLAIGAVMVNSASVEIAQFRTGNAAYFALRHGIYIALALLIAFVVYQIPVQIWRSFAFPLLALSALVLLLILIPGVGKNVNGSTRWIAIGGMTVQPSEFAKLAVVIYVADYLCRYHQQVRQQWIGILKPLGLTGIIALLVLVEPDFGTAFVIGLTVVTMLFFAGAPVRRFFLMAIPLGPLVWYLAVFEPYRVARLTSFVNPWEDQFSSGYQLVQSLIAIGRGNLAGQGIGNSIQKMFYLPEAHTDFVVAVIGEEFGVLGILALILLLTLLVWGAFAMVHRMMQKPGNEYACYLIVGITSLLVVQSFVNVGVNIGILPTKGITLPLVSYGGSSLIATCAGLAMVLRAYHEFAGGAR